MKALSPFPHDPSYDADFVNGEIFDGNDDLSKVGSVAPCGPSGNVGSNDSFAPSAQDTYPIHPLYPNRF